MSAAPVAPNRPDELDKAAPAGDVTEPTAVRGRRARLTAWTAAYLLLSVGLLSVGVETAIHFNGPPIDGPFQLYNALRRSSGLP